jgi:ABC-type Fe3+-hydroxamate transport system substrate-binding protein
MGTGADGANIVTSQAFKLSIGGDGIFSGSVTATSFFQSSDIRLKNIIKRDGDVIYYTWKDKRDTKTHIGYIAQKVKAKNPDQVNKDDKGMLSVNYIEILVEKIRNLEKEIELLKSK